MRYLFILWMLLLISACAAVPEGRSPLSVGADGSDELLTRIRTYSFEGESDEIRKTGKRFLSRFPDDPAATEVRLLVASADVEMGFFDEAARLAGEVIAGDSGERERAEALLVVSEVEKARGGFDEAAQVILRVIDMEIDRPVSMKARESLTSIADLLPPETQDALIAAHEDSKGIEIIMESRLQYAEAIGDTAAVRVIGERLDALYAERPGEPQRPSGGTTVPVSALQRTAGLPKIGILCPLSGRFSPVGDAFLKGASIAVREAVKRSSLAVELVVGNSRGDPLTARSAAEKLIDEEGVVAVVGAVLSSPTIAAAQVAEYRETVLLSPVATEEGISEIGEWIFQMSAGVDVEVISISRLACAELGMKRLAFLAADNARSRSIERLFSREIEARGGLLCAAEFYQEGSTDFKEHLEVIRRSHPEGLFIASDVDDLVLILPQISYYEFGVQLLGTSAWHSNRLLRMSARDMEGAIFPQLPEVERDEELLAAAFEYVGESSGEFNTFIVGGYMGTRAILAALAEGATDREAMRGAVSRTLENRPHVYLEFVSGPGITFYTVHDERFGIFLSQK
jgi:ABC-type branched-subunit amino acid transport system substrate-binding protein